MDAMKNGIDKQSDDWEVIIHTYSRRQAVEDGVLVDVSEIASEAGFCFPVALTQAVWNECVSVPAGRGIDWQSEEGRLWDILWMLRCQIARSHGGGQELRFTVLVNNGDGPKPTELKAHCGPNDDLTPCITVLLPHED
jgi:hypothetical protein